MSYDKKSSDARYRMKKFGHLGYAEKRCVVCDARFIPATSRELSCSTKACGIAIRRRSKNEYQKRYHARKKKDPLYLFGRFLLKSIRRMISAKTLVKSMYCDYTAAQFRSHIESKFHPGMSWSNYGEWHVDHKKPLTLFRFVKQDGTEDVEEIKRANALDNLQPLWAVDNLRKNNKFYA